MARSPESLPIRWGFVRDDYPPTPIKISKTSDAVWIETDSVKIKAGLRPFRLAMFDKNGRTVFQERGMSYGAGNALQVEMHADEHFYGLGFQRMALDVRGRKLQWWRSFRSSEATVPFFMSTRGYGFYSNNT